MFTYLNYWLLSNIVGIFQFTPTVQGHQNWSVSYTNTEIPITQIQVITKCWERPNIKLLENVIPPAPAAPPMEPTIRALWCHDPRLLVCYISEKLGPRTSKLIFPWIIFSIFLGGFANPEGVPTSDWSNFGLSTNITFYPVSPFFGVFLAGQYFRYFRLHTWKRERVSLESVRDGSIKFKFQRNSILSELCAVKVFILECCETKQDRGGRGRPNPDRYSQKRTEKNMDHLE